MSCLPPRTATLCVFWSLCVWVCTDIHMKVCPVGFTASSWVFMKVCKVDVGSFDLQSGTCLESGARRLTSSSKVQVRFHHEVIAQAD